MTLHCYYTGASLSCHSLLEVVLVLLRVSHTSLISLGVRDDSCFALFSADEISILSAEIAHILSEREDHCDHATEHHVLLILQDMVIYEVKVY